jgi:hypothetical protein
VSFPTSAPGTPYRFRCVLSSFLQISGLAFAHVLAEEDIQRACDEEGVDFGQPKDEQQKIIYTPAVTLWAFLSQVLFQGEQRSCLAATARIVVFMASLEIRMSDNSGPYCRARAKLSESLLQRMTLDVARGCEKAIPKEWLWHNRHVYLADGTTVSMLDTDDNQKAYPQHGAQKKGVGFPIARMVLLLSLATAMVAAMSLGPYQGKPEKVSGTFCILWWPSSRPHRRLKPKPLDHPLCPPLIAKGLSSPNTTPNRLQLRLRLRCVHMCGPTARPCHGPIRQKLLLLRGAKLPTPQSQKR